MKNYPILYHYIPLNNLQLFFEDYKKENKFFLKTNSAPHRTNDKPILSLSRNPSMNSVDLLLSKQLCRITLDGEKLSQRYKLRPYADSSYTKGSDNEQEEMMYVPDFLYGNEYNTNHPNRYRADITDCILRIDILSKPHKIKDTQGYVGWTKKHDRLNPKYYRDNDQKGIEQDHSIEIKNTYKLISDMDLPFNVKVVNKFVNYKYQDRFIDKWNKNGYLMNQLKSFESFIYYTTSHE